MITDPITEQPLGIAAPATEHGVGFCGFVIYEGTVILSTSVATSGLFAVRVKV